MTLYIDGENLGTTDVSIIVNGIDGSIINPTLGY